ncbi:MULTISPECIES: HD domain-containing protein [unclassified Acidocella]|uniref:HD domain-containing protein n=1 Tax=unclassified Acidocella TaxID=2648610 RepID=UPI00028E694E|nr:MULTISPECIES: HD domain-containing protein [unclassified Acidocella]EKN01369.1 metal dependent phosphohydrolase [Acidocella sp. MX-AZ02]WBO60878.1 HD domain-containing protein [Acidocella sp. MX-AZ03]
MDIESGCWVRLIDAAAFALRLHAEQRRKGSDTPYIAHLLGVASLVLEFNGDEDQAIAGLLHDAIEDQGIEQEPVIKAKYGLRVATIVRGCTDAETLPKPPWRARKEAYIAHLEEAGPDVWLVSCADKLYNARAIVTDLRTLGEEMFSRFTGGKEGTLWYYQNLATAFARIMPGSLSSELGVAVDEMRRLAG